MKKIFLVLLVLVSTATAFAQSGTNSPYSQFGLGVLSDQSGGFNRGMNGLALGFREHNQVNFLNPASYSNVDSLTFLFDAGFSMEKTNYKEGGKRLNANTSNFEYVTAALRLGKNLGFSFGILPYTNIGYEYESTGYIGNSRTASYTNLYEGEGGLRQVYLGAGYQLLSGKTKEGLPWGFSIGANLSYLWGDYNRTMINSYSDTYASNLLKYYTAEVRSYKIDLGVQYFRQLNKDNEITIGATFGLGHKIGGHPQCLVVTTNNQTIVSDTTVSGDKNTQLEIPMTFGLGAVWTYRNKWRTGIDYTLQRWGSVKYPEASITDDGLRYQLREGLFADRHKVTIGTEYCPVEYGRKFFSRIKYRAGISYATPYLKINGKNGPREFSASLGFGIPIVNGWNNRSILNISGQWVRQDASSFITENTFRLNIGLTFNELWFQKWKFK
ncbi:MAG: hypothetical protein IJS97_00710 [Prevotella sp.]|nr:hypothetical protein [Prevotella sp.]